MRWEMSGRAAPWYIGRISRLATFCWWQHSASPRTTFSALSRIQSKYLSVDTWESERLFVWKKKRAHCFQCWRSRLDKAKKTTRIRLSGSHLALRSWQPMEERTHFETPCFTKIWHVLYYARQASLPIMQILGVTRTMQRGIPKYKSCLLITQCDRFGPMSENCRLINRTNAYRTLPLTVPFYKRLGGWKPISPKWSSSGRTEDVFANVPAVPGSWPRCLGYCKNPAFKQLPDKAS